MPDRCGTECRNRAEQDRRMTGLPSGLAAWAHVGKNPVPSLLNRFGVQEPTGHAKIKSCGVFA